MIASQPNIASSSAFGKLQDSDKEIYIPQGPSLLASQQAIVSTKLQDSYNEEYLVRTDSIASQQTIVSTKLQGLEDRSQDLCLVHIERQVIDLLNIPPTSAGPYSDIIAVETEPARTFCASACCMSHVRPHHLMTNSVVPCRLQVSNGMRAFCLTVSDSPSVAAGWSYWWLWAENMLQKKMPLPEQIFF